MAFLKEFKEFAMKGNVMDLAVAVIIGAAFGKIVTSLVNDIIMPIISLVAGNIDFSNFFISLDGKNYETLKLAKEAGAATLNYGVFITNVIDFLIVAFSIFIVIKQLNRFKPKPATAVSTAKTCPYCRSTIHIEAVKCPYCISEIK